MNYSLEPIFRSDQEFIFEGLSHPDVIRYYGVSYDSLEATSDQMDFYENLEKEKTGISWKIVDLSTKKPIGVVVGCYYQPQHQRIEIGFWLLPSAQGKGVMKTILPAAIDQLKSNFLIHRLEALVETPNKACCRVLENAGFQHEGVLRDYEIKNGQRISLIVYSLLLDS